MIRRQISAAHICLRCQIRLGQRHLPSSGPRAYSTRLGADHEGNGFGTLNGQSQRNDSEWDSNEDTAYHNEQDLDTMRPPEWPPQWHDDIVIRRPHGIMKPPRLSRETRHFKGAEPKVYGRTGTKAFGDSVTLSGVNSLGKNAEVLVLRDTKLRFYKEKARSIDQDPTPENIDILAQVQSERGIISPEDVETNINEFKPQPDKIQTWNDFNDLVQSLQDSFTHPQLNRYIQSYPHSERMKKVPSLGVAVLFDEQMISRATAWVPEISPISQPIDNSSMRGYSPPSYNGKQNLVVRLLRECWRLEVPELAEGIGEVEVQVQIKDLDFLMSQGYIESVIKRYYLSEPEKIEIYRPRQVLRITSSREKSALIIDEIQEGIRNISREEFELKEICPPHFRRGWESRTLTHEVLTKLGELTKTNIKRLPHQEPLLLISSMVTDPESKLSKRVDVVRRLLLDFARVDENEHNSKKIGLRSFNESSYEVDLPGGFVRFPGSRELSWHEKLRTWSRWITSTPKSTNDNVLPEKTQYTFPFNTVGINLFGASQKRSDPAGAEFLWSHEYSPTTLIKAGTVLHNISSHRIGKHLDDEKDSTAGHGRISPNKTLIMNKLKAEMDAGSMRIFSTQAPNLSGLFQSDLIDKKVPGIMTQELVMQFKPNPWGLCPSGKPIGPTALSDFPPIEIFFTIDPKSYEVKFREIHAVVSTETADLMLPELKADLQFDRKIRSRMLFKESNSNDRLDGIKSAAKSVKDFIKSSQLDLGSDRQLETPPKLVLPIAKHLCAERGWKRMADNPKFGANVEYLFSKLEYRKTAAYNFDNHEIFCTSIEAGKAGGSRLELSLASPSMPNQDETNDIMETALNMIQLMDMKNITSVYGQLREVYPERKPLVLGPDDFKFVPKRPSDFLNVKRLYNDEERKSRFEGTPAKQEDHWSAAEGDSHHFKGRA